MTAPLFMLSRTSLPLLAIIPLVLGGCGSTGVAKTEEVPYRQSVEQVCKSDVEKYCAKVEPGQGRMKQCFDAHKDKLTLDCRMLMQSPEESARTCEGDVAKFCAKVKPGDGRILDCLEAKREQLTPECRSVVKLQLMDWDV